MHSVYCDINFTMRTIRQEFFSILYYNRFFIPIEYQQSIVLSILSLKNNNVSIQIEDSILETNCIQSNNNIF